MKRSILIIFLFGTILGGKNIENQQQANADNFLNRINGTTITAGCLGALTEIIRHKGAHFMMRSKYFHNKTWRDHNYFHNNNSYLRYKEDFVTYMVGAISKPFALNTGHTIAEYYMNPSSLQQK